VKKPAPCRFFRFQGLKNLRTACFVDGYNLFYGLLADIPLQVAKPPLMTPALRALREDFEALCLGVILPHRESHKRKAPGSLRQYAHWMRHVVTDDELASRQFPNRIPTRKKPVDKPAYW
jgi:hypothetical protein